MGVQEFTQGSGEGAVDSFVSFRLNKMNLCGKYLKLNSLLPLFLFPLAQELGLLKRLSSGKNCGVLLLI